MPIAIVLHCGVRFYAVYHIVQIALTPVNKMAGYSEVSVSDGATTLSVLNIERSYMYLVQYTLPMNIAMSLCGIQYFLCNTPTPPRNVSGF